MNNKKLFLELVKVALVSIGSNAAVLTFWRASQLTEGCIPPTSGRMAAALGLPTIDVAAMDFVNWSALCGEEPEWVEFEDDDNAE